MALPARPTRYRPRARGPQRPSAEATTAGDLMGDVLARLGGSGRAREFRVFESFNRVVGETFRSRTLPEQLTGTTLFVRVATAALAHELTLLRIEILDRMALELGPGLVVDLRTRVGRVP